MAGAGEIEVRLADLPQVRAVFETTAALVDGIGRDLKAMPPEVQAHLEPLMARLDEACDALKREAT